MEDNKMIKYFAKYLPVEGEIKEGQTGISVNNATYTHYEHLGKDYGKPAKLFLCSRDIQIGDKVFGLLLDKSGYKEHTLTNSTDEVKLAIESGDFKVIGEISPEATWVKEGDEFEQYEVAIIYLNPPIDGVVYEDKVRQFMGIKGPCGHFH